MVVRSFIVGYPVVAPGENGDVHVDTFFSAWPMTVGDLVGTDSGVCPDDGGETENQEQYGDKESYD